MKKENKIIPRFYAVVLVLLLINVSISSVIGWNIRDPSGTTAGYWDGGVQYIMNSNGKTWTITIDNIQTAYYDLNSTNGGWIHIGTDFTLDGTLKPINNTQFICDGIITISGENDGKIKIHNLTNVTFKDCYFECDTTARNDTFDVRYSSDIHLINVDGYGYRRDFSSFSSSLAPNLFEARKSDQISIEQCDIKSWVQTPFLFFHSTNVTFKDNDLIDIIGSTTYGGSTTNTAAGGYFSNVSHFDINLNWCDYIDDNAFAIITGSNNGSMTNNHVERCRHFTIIHNNSGYQNAEKIDIVGNTILNTQKPFILGWTSVGYLNLSCNDILIANNRIEVNNQSCPWECSSNFFFEGIVDNITINNNEIYNFQDIECIYYDSSLYGRYTNINIVNNRFFTGNNEHIDTGTSSDKRFRKCLIDNNKFMRLEDSTVASISGDGLVNSTYSNNLIDSSINTNRKYSDFGYNTTVWKNTFINENARATSNLVCFYLNIFTEGSILSDFENPESYLNFGIDNSTVNTISEGLSVLGNITSHGMNASSGSGLKFFDDGGDGFTLLDGGDISLGGLSLENSYGNVFGINHEDGRARLEMKCYDDAPDLNYFDTYAARGTSSSPTAVQADDRIFKFVNKAYNGSAWKYNSILEFTVNSSYAGGDNPGGKMAFKVMDQFDGGTMTMYYYADNSKTGGAYLDVDGTIHADAALDVSDERLKVFIGDLDDIDVKDFCKEINIDFFNWRDYKKANQDHGLIIGETTSKIGFATSAQDLYRIACDYFGSHYASAFVDVGDEDTTWSINVNALMYMYARFTQIIYDEQANQQAFLKTLGYNSEENYR